MLQMKVYGMFFTFSVCLLYLFLLAPNADAKFSIFSKHAPSMHKMLKSHMELHVGKPVEVQPVQTRESQPAQLVQVRVPKREIVGRGLTQLDQDRIDAALKITLVPNHDCEDFISVFSNYTSSDFRWVNVGIGVFVGFDTNFEYYQLALPPSPGVCGNAFGIAFVKLETTPILNSIELDGDTVSIYSSVTYHLTPDFLGGFLRHSYGHYNFAKFSFAPNSSISTQRITEDVGGEITLVSNIYSPAQSPSDACGLMYFAQLVISARVGYDVSNTTGWFPTGNPAVDFPDCISTMAALLASPACGTPFIDYTPQCFIRHAITGLADGADTGHILHHMNRDPAKNTHCKNRCDPVKATCHATADPVVANSVDHDTGAFTYFCRCPEGYKGDGVTSCDAVSCTKDADCKDPRFAHCNFESGLCNADVTAEWDPVLGKAVCPEGKEPHMNSTTNKFDCLFSHHCWTKQQCSKQDPSTVQCVRLDNLASPLNTCICNPGYYGGYSFPCVCDTGKTEYPVGAGTKVCLAAGECTLDEHCAAGEQCSSTDPMTIGTCSVSP